jgi:hypothetical protein
VVVAVDDAAVVRLLEEQGRLHRNLGIQDVYKLLFQGVMGVAHILEAREKARRELQKEFEDLDASEFLGEPLLERVSADGSVVRANLRPFKRLGVSLEGLFEAMLRSAKRIRADKDRFAALWKRFMELVKAGRLDFDYERLIEFDGIVRTRGYPPVHHSRAYAKDNEPAYRVVHKKSYQEIFG